VMSIFEGVGARLFSRAGLVVRAPVHDDLDAVTTIRHDAEVDARRVGVDPAGIEQIWSAVRDVYRAGIHPAIQVCLRRRGEIVLDRAIGYSHGAGPSDGPGAKKVRATPDTPFNIFSASKPMVAMAIHLLNERHLLHLDDPICHFIPEFAAHGKRWVTVRHVLAHRSGIPTLDEDVLDLRLLEDTRNREALRLLCDAEASSRAGGRLAYHAITGGFLLGEIVHRVSGKPLRRFLDDEIRGPMGWRWMNYGVGRRDVKRVAKNYFTGLPVVPPLKQAMKRILGMDFVDVVDASNDPRFLMGVLPSANLMATAEEQSEFYELLRCGGETRGVRIFDPLTIWRATSEQSYMEVDYTLGAPIRYGMGFMLGGESVGLFGPETEHAFGHVGFTNVIAWADPQRELSAAILTNGKPLLFPEMLRVTTLMQTIAEVFPKEPGVPSRADIGGAATGPRRAKAKQKKATPKKSARKKATPKKAVSKVVTRKQATKKKVAAKKAPAKKVSAKKAATTKMTKKVQSKKAPAKKATSKKAGSQKATSKKLR
jgi:CubicO group peptidase (beta-lactamase class C family)